MQLLIARGDNGITQHNSSPRGARAKDAVLTRPFQKESVPKGMKRVLCFRGESFTTTAVKTNRACDRI